MKKTACFYTSYNKDSNCWRIILIKYYFRVWDICIYFVGYCILLCLNEAHLSHKYFWQSLWCFNQDDEWGLWRQEATASDFGPRKLWALTLSVFSRKQVYPWVLWPQISLFACLSLLSSGFSGQRTQSLSLKK